MDVKVIGAGCPDCDKLKASTEAALKELGINAEIQRITALKDIVLLGVMTAPSLLVDGKLLISGQAASKEEVKKQLEKLL
ncbi:MAG: TM0996/MTH895 family glutaredoxin-like protein [Oscillospiraceae bacterium]|nr:TM0996/MTH895 family glutaredoxin-like protein [Oscillospiraceae bacterium]